MLDVDWKSKAPIERFEDRTSLLTQNFSPFIFCIRLGLSSAASPSWRSTLVTVSVISSLLPPPRFVFSLSTPSTNFSFSVLVVQIQFAPHHWYYFITSMTSICLESNFASTFFSPSQTLVFLNSKAKQYYLQKQKAAKFHWTVVYRKLHKKVRKALPEFFLFSPAKRSGFFRWSLCRGLIRVPTLSWYISWYKSCIFRISTMQGQTEQAVRKRARRVQRVARSIEGTTLDVLKKKKNQKPEERQAAREAALKELKKRKEAQKVARKDAKSKTVGSTTGGKQATQKAKGANTSKGR
jgi:hypothetical protein